MNSPPAPDETFLNMENDQMVTYIGQEDGEYLFSRPAEGTLSIPTELWLDDDVDWFESQGFGP